MKRTAVTGRIGWREQRASGIQDRMALVLATGKVSLGDHTAFVEASWPQEGRTSPGGLVVPSAIVGASQTVVVANGTAALELVWRVLGCMTVIVPEMTVPMVKWAPQRAIQDQRRSSTMPGVHEVGVDRFLCASIDEIDALIARARPDELRDGRWGVCYVATAGLVNPAFPEAAARWRSAGVRVVVDMSHAHGGAINGYGLYTFADAAIWSFYATKVLTSGEGGIAWFVDDRHAERARTLSNQGKRRGTGEFVEQGFNMRLSEAAAAMMAEEVLHSAEIYAARRAVAEAYDKAGIPGLHQTVPGLRSAFYKYVLPATATKFGQGGAQALELAFAEHGVRCTGRVHGVADNYNRPWSGPLARSWANSHVCLPIGRLMQKDDIDIVVAAWEKVRV